jgi:hypothetical protein
MDLFFLVFGSLLKNVLPTQPASTAFTTVLYFKYKIQYYYYYYHSNICSVLWEFRHLNEKFHIDITYGKKSHYMEKLDTLEATLPWQSLSILSLVGQTGSLWSCATGIPTKCLLGRPGMGWCPADHNRGCWPALDTPFNIQPVMRDGFLLVADIKLCVYHAGPNQPSKGWSLLISLSSL